MGEFIALLVPLGNSENLTTSLSTLLSYLPLKNLSSLVRRERLEDIGEIESIPLNKMHLHLVSNIVATASISTK